MKSICKIPLSCSLILCASVLHADATSTYIGKGANNKGTYNVSVGASSGLLNDNAPVGNISVGYAANFNANGAYRVAIGKNAGSSGNGDNVITIGDFAGEGTQGNRMVLIGASEYTNKTVTAGVTSINGRQIYINADENEFAINPVQDTDSISNAPLYYKNGTIYFNASVSLLGDIGNNTERLLLSSPEGIKKYVDAKTFKTEVFVKAKKSEFDLYMAPYGDDNYAGTMEAPKATFEGCISALGENGGTIGVLPGQYLPISLSTEESILLYAPTGNCRFVAIGGKERTAVVGEYANAQSFADGLRHTMAFASGNQTFEGFTFVKIGGYKDTATSDGFAGTAPAFSCLTLKDCLVTDCKIDIGFCYGAFNTCYIKDSTLENISFVCYSEEAESEIFCNCAIVDTVVKGIQVACTNTARFFGTATESYYSVFDLPMPDAKELENRNNCKFEFCTFIWNTNATTIVKRVSPDKASNCYFCVGDGTLDGGSSNVFASVGNTLLSDAYIPQSIDCPAIRTDGAPDAGWRDSGLSELKIMSLRPYLKLEDGSIGVYSNNTKIATIAL